MRSKLVLVAGAIAVGLALFSLSAISERQSDGAGEPGIDELAQRPFDSVANGLKYGESARPLTGVGLVNATENYYFYTPIWQGGNHAVHSTWLGIFAETGFPASLWS